MDVMRKLIDCIILTPVEEEEGARKSLSIDLYGHLAGILSLANKAQKPLKLEGINVTSMKLVAGAGFEPATFGL